MIIDTNSLFGVSWEIVITFGFVIAALFLLVTGVFALWLKPGTLAFQQAFYSTFSVLPLTFIGMVVGVNSQLLLQWVNDQTVGTDPIINVTVASFIGISVFIWINMMMRVKMREHFEKLNTMTQSIAEGDLRISKESLKVPRNDVLYGFYYGFEAMIVELQSVIKRIRTAATSVATTAEQIAASSSEVSSSSESISAIMENISQGTQEQVARANDARNSAENLGVTINESFERIEEVLQLTLAIAEETNLLALNAAIEAQRAGEAGRGFAVVAKNVRRLADDSRNYVDEIEEVIRNAITLIQEGQQNITNSVAQISEVSEDVATASEEVAASAEEQTATMEELVAATSELSSLANSLELTLQKFTIEN